MVDEILTVSELSKYLKLRPRTLYVKLGKGEIPGSKIGRTWRFQKSTIDKWLAENAMQKIKKR